MSKTIEYSIPRDHKVAQDIGERARLGYFPVEFTMYGCAYLYQGKMYYKVSSEAEDIYNFIENANLNKIYPSNVIKETQKYAVPSGAKELITQDVKKELAKKMHKKFPKDFFVKLEETANLLRTNTAASYLWNRADELESVYDSYLLEQFSILVNYFYSCCHLDDDNYFAIMKWLDEERKNMDDDVTYKDLYEKTIYGFAYVIDEKIKYFSNAKKEITFRKKYEAEQEGFFVSPIIQKTYWYNRGTSNIELFKDFEIHLQETFTANFFETMKRLFVFESNQKRACWKKHEAIREQYGDKCADTYARYLMRWGIVKD